MNLLKLIQQLKEFQDWRRGGDGDQPHPREIGVAIDQAMEALADFQEFIAADCFDSPAMADTIVKKYTPKTEKT